MSHTSSPAWLRCFVLASLLSYPVLPASSALAACLTGHTGAVANGTEGCAKDSDCCLGYCVLTGHDPATGKTNVCCGPDGEGCAPDPAGQVACVSDGTVCSNKNYLCCADAPSPNKANPCNNTTACCSPVGGECDKKADCCGSTNATDCVKPGNGGACGAPAGGTNQDCFCCAQDNDNANCTATWQCCDSSASCHLAGALDNLCCRDVGAACSSPGQCCSAVGTFVGEACLLNPSTRSDSCCVLTDTGAATSGYACTSANDPNCCTRYCNEGTQKCATCRKDSDCATGNECCPAGNCGPTGTCSDKGNANGLICSFGSDCASGYCPTSGSAPDECAACTTDAQCSGTNGLGTGSFCCGGVCAKPSGGCCGIGQKASTAANCCAGLGYSGGLCNSCVLDGDCPSGDTCCGGTCGTACCNEGQTAGGISDCCSPLSAVSNGADYTCYAPIGTNCGANDQCLSENCTGSPMTCACAPITKPSVLASSCCGYESCFPNPCSSPIELGCVGSGCSGANDCCYAPSTTGCTNSNQCCGPNVTTCGANVNGVNECCNTASTASTACSSDIDCCSPEDECAMDAPAGSRTCKIVAGGKWCTSDSECATGYAGSCNKTTGVCAPGYLYEHCLHTSDCVGALKCTNFECRE